MAGTPGKSCCSTVAEASRKPCTPSANQGHIVRNHSNLKTYLTHHNTYEESQHIHREYRARLLELDDNRYYQEIDNAYQTYGPLPAQDYIPANQAPGPRRTTQELMQIFGKGRGPQTSTFQSKNKIIAESHTVKD